MSLMSRSHFDAVPKGESCVSSRNQVLSELKLRLQSVIPTYRLASMLEKSPRQAESEIRVACEKIIEQEPWVFAAEEGQFLIEKLLDGIFGFGPLEGLLADESITEIMVNGSQSLFYEKDGCLQESLSHFASDEQVYALIDKILGPAGRRVDESSPMVNTRLFQGHRVNIIIPPLALDGPVVTIRKFRTCVFTLQELTESESIDEEVCIFLRWAMKTRCNIAVSGGTGSGKTTLLNALSCEISSSERIVTIEDSAELRFLEHPHVIRLESRPRNAEGVGEITIRDLVINALRMRPDRIVVGECRGAEAFDMLQAMNTGHDGSLTTLHANSTYEAIGRLTAMVRYATDLPVEVIEHQIAYAINLIIQTTRSVSGKRFVCEIAECRYDTQARKCEVEILYERKHEEKKGEWVSVPSWLFAAENTGIVESGEFRKWKQQVAM